VSLMPCGSMRTTSRRGCRTGCML